MKKEEIHLATYRILLYVFAFAMPFSTPSIVNSQGVHFWGNITPTLIGLFLLNWLLEADFKTKLQRIKTDKLIFPFFAAIGFYGFYLIGLTYSSNLDFGRQDVFLKLPFLLFPLLIFTMNPAMWKPKTAQNLLFTFALGNLSTLFISLIHSFFLCKETFSIEYFHYMNASLFFHSSYASMYYCFSFVIALYFLIDKQLHLWKKITAWIMFLLFPSEIVLLDSRAGQIAFVFAMFAFTFYIFIFNRKRILRFSLHLSLLLCLLVATYLLLPNNRLFANIQQMRIETIETESEGKEQGTFDATRSQIWISAVAVVKERPVLGVGTGDVKDALMEKYIQKDFEYPQERRFNAHNQYLQIAVTLGLVGLTLFFVFLGSIFLTAWKKRNILLFLFGLIGLVNFLTESMFEKQIGVMFFAFFFALLHYIAAKNLLKEETSA